MKIYSILFHSRSERTEDDAGISAHHTFQCIQLLTLNIFTGQLFHTLSHSEIRLLRAAISIMTTKVGCCYKPDARLAVIMPCESHASPFLV